MKKYITHLGISLFLFTNIHSAEIGKGVTEFKCAIYGRITVNKYTCSGIGLVVNLDPNDKTESQSVTYYTDKEGGYCVDAKIEENQYICYRLKINNPKAPGACFKYAAAKHKIKDLDVKAKFSADYSNNCTKIRPLD